MSNETKTFNTATIAKGQEVRDVDSDTTVILTITDIAKRGRWYYITVNGEEFSEGKFFAQFAEVKKARTDSPLRKVAPVSDATLDDALTAEDIEAGREDLASSPVLGLTGFNKFRAIHKAEKVETSTGSKVRTQSVRDDIANSLLDGIEEYGSIWLVPMVANNLPVAELKARYAHLNSGMIRMNVGNMLRAMFRKAAEATAAK